MGMPELVVSVLGPLLLIGASIVYFWRRHDLKKRIETQKTEIIAMIEETLHGPKGERIKQRERMVDVKSTRKGLPAAIYFIAAVGVAVLSIGAWTGAVGHFPPWSHPTTIYVPPTPTPTPTPTSTIKSTPTPELTPIPTRPAASITVSPTSGVALSTITVSGTGFKPYWGITVSMGAGPAYTFPTQVFTDVLGAFTFTGLVPGLAPGATVVSASDGTSTAATTFTVLPTPTTPANVEISGFAFVPSTLTVSVGTTVTWTNNDSVTHTVTSNDNLFNSGNLANGATFQHTFNQKGTFQYHCSIHTSMTAKVIVE